MGRIFSKSRKRRDGVPTRNPRYENVRNGGAGFSPVVVSPVPTSPVGVQQVNVNVGVPRAQSVCKVVRALYDYEPRQPDDLGFRKDDRMEIIKETGSNVDWWYARHVVTKNEGFIPSNYVVTDNDSPESQDWWFAVDRREAERNLMFPGNPRGTFLVRYAADSTSYALSIRDFDTTTQDFNIRHYRIRKMDNGFVFIAAKRIFPTVVQLIQYYQSAEDGLCCLLTKPCAKEPEQIPFKDLEVDRSELQLLTKLGAGQFGDVHQGKWRRMIDVAVKTLKPGSMSHEAFLEEAKIMHRLRHRKLVQLMGVCTLGEPIYIIVELMVNGALLDYLRKDEGQTIKFSHLLDIVAQVADAMAYLEEQSYIHRDLRAANILVGENNTVKVADFGLARVIDASTETEDVYMASEDAKFPIKWTAPEALMYRQFSIKSDVWSFGILLYEIVTYGRVPYPGMNNQTTLKQITSGYKMPKPFGENIVCPDEMYDVMLNCWQMEAEHRPTFEYLKSLYEDFFVATASSYDEQR